MKSLLSRHELMVFSFFRPKYILQSQRTTLFHLLPVSKVDAYAKFVGSGRKVTRHNSMQIKSIHIIVIIFVMMNDEHFLLGKC